MLRAMSLKTDWNVALKERNKRFKKATERILRDEEIRKLKPLPYMQRLVEYGDYMSDGSDSGMNVGDDE